MTDKNGHIRPKKMSVPGSITDLVWHHGRDDWPPWVCVTASFRTGRERRDGWRLVFEGADHGVMWVHTGRPSHPDAGAAGFDPSWLERGREYDLVFPTVEGQARPGPEALGLVAGWLSPEEFKELCLSVREAHFSRRHFDLHCGNVLSTLQHVKIIDLGGMEDDLLAGDLARLEVSLWYELARSGPQSIGGEEAAAVLRALEAGEAGLGTLAGRDLNLARILYGLRLGFLKGQRLDLTPREIALAYVSQVLLFQRYYLQDDEPVPESFASVARHWVDHLRRLQDDRAGRSLRPNAASGCEVIDAFASKKEPPFRFHQGTAQFEGERGYALTCYMFAHREFERFRALDLAFPRWEELANRAAREESQTVNLSDKLLNTIERLVLETRCPDFKRILVATEEQFTRVHKNKQVGRDTLREIHRREEKMRDDLHRELARRRERGDLSEGGEALLGRVERGERVIETRLLKFPSNVYFNPLQDRIKELKDFTVFLGIRPSGVGAAPNDLAIIETSRSNPTAELQDVQYAKFEVTLDPKRLTDMARGFDELWKMGVFIGDELAAAPAPAPAPAGTAQVPTPALKAFETYRDKALARAGSVQPVAVVEGCYFDRREDSAEDRLFQLRDSFRLIRHFEELGADRPEVILAALVNNFSQNRSCGRDYCGDALPSDVPVESERLPDWARSVYNENKVDQTWPVHVFHFTETRNRVIRWLKDELKKAPAATPRVEERIASGGVDLYAAGHLSTPIYLGRRRGGSANDSKYKIRCSALLAQHYFDLFETRPEGCPWPDRLLDL